MEVGSKTWGSMSRKVVMLVGRQRVGCGQVKACLGECSVDAEDDVGCRDGASDGARSLLRQISIIQEAKWVVGMRGQVGGCGG